MRGKVLFCISGLFLIIAAASSLSNISYAYSKKDSNIDTAIEKIKKTCADSYSAKMSREFVANGGSLPTEKGIFACSKLERLEGPFSYYLKPGLKFIDLGSGDGRVVFLASLFGVEAYGIELDERLYNISLKALKRLSNKNILESQRVTLIHGDFFGHDLSPYDIIFLNIGAPQLQKLMEKIYKEIKKGGILIMYRVPSYMGEIKTLRPMDDFSSASAKTYGRSVKIYKKE